MTNIKTLFNFKSVIELLDYFKDEKTCIAFYEQIRWNGSPVCPHCGSCKTPYRTAKGFKCSEKLCHKKFTVKVGTIFQQSHIPLRTWFAAIYLQTAHKKGISSLQLGRDLHITQKTAWYLLHRIREMLRAKEPVMLRGTIEADEAYLGGKDKNRHKHKKKGSIGTQDKIVMLGLVEKGGRVFAKHIKAPTKEEIAPVLEKHIELGSGLHTDEHYGYTVVGKKFQHKTVKHLLHIYVDGDVTTNTIEGFWANLKRGIYGIYHYASEKHIDRYLDEFCARYNTRHIGEDERFENFLKQSESRLTWKRLTA
jgi:transposase-like protein